jgi:hypothetical protein
MKTIILYAIGVYLTFLCFGLYLNNAHGEQQPYISHTDGPQRTKPSLSCGEYLHICESSCNRRGDMYRFLCLGPDFTQGLEQYRCQCGDDAFRQVARKEQRQPEPKQAAVKTTEQEPKQ